MEAAQTDAMYFPTYTQYIILFMTKTSKEFAIQDIMDVLLRLCESDYVRVLSQNPSDTHAISCIRHFINTRSGIPSNFIDRLLSVFRTKIRLTSIISNASSVTAKIIVDNVEPIRKMTNLTLKTKTDLLHDNISTNLKSLPNRSQVIPNLAKINMNQDTITNAIKSIVNLQSVIEQANKQNGTRMDPYIVQQCK